LVLNLSPLNGNGPMTINSATEIADAVCIFWGGTRKLILLSEASINGGAASFRWRAVVLLALIKFWSSALLGRRERADRDVVSVWISERELLGLCVRIHVGLLFEPSDESSCPLKRQVEIIDTEEQEEAVAGCRVIGADQ